MIVKNLQVFQKKTPGHRKTNLIKSHHREKSAKSNQPTSLLLKVRKRFVVVLSCGVQVVWLNGWKFLAQTKYPDYGQVEWLPVSLAS